MNDIKQNFLDGLTVSMQKHYVLLFTQAETLEQELGNDLAEFTTQQFEELLLSTYKLRTFSHTSNVKARIKIYVKWYNANVKPVNTSEITDVNIAQLVDRYNQNQKYFMEIIQLFDEINKCEQFLSTIGASHVDPDYFLFHKIVCMFLWYGYDIKQILNLKWSDLDGKLNNYKSINGNNIYTVENNLLSKWFLKAGTFRGRSSAFMSYPDTPYVLKGSPAGYGRVTNALGELNIIENQMIINDDVRYSFDAINIRTNGNMALAMHREQEHPIVDENNLREYSVLLQIAPTANDAEVQAMVHLYKYYKKLIK